jgi:hypothetical protein
MVINSRRLMQNIGVSNSRRRRSVYRTLNLPQGAGAGAVAGDWISQRWVSKRAGVPDVGMPKRQLLHASIH